MGSSLSSSGSSFSSILLFFLTSSPRLAAFNLNFIFFTLLWGISVVIKDASIIDSFWGISFITSATTYFLHPNCSNGFRFRKWLILILTSVWGSRLSLYLFWRNHGKGEDFRYQAMRRASGDRFWWISFFKVFLLQALISFVISQPLLPPQESQEPSQITFNDSLGTIIWAIGFFFESVSDLQLAKFKSDPKNSGKLLTSGLWKYSRHPNYFGDALIWWGFYLISTSVKDGWKTIFSPVLMTFFLNKVSGIPLLEKAMKRSKPDYNEYLKQTSAFVPWIPSSTSIK